MAKKITLLTILGILTQACSPFYVIEAAYHETGILLRRQSINSALRSGDLSNEEQLKLALVKEAREFTIKLGLQPGETYTKFSRVNRETLAWVLMGSKLDAFELYTWWFPIVGSVPYKGYFSKEDAECSAKSLRFEGYETYVRGTDAFSTLGWFNDPVLSTTLRHSPSRIVNTVIHETLHRTVWIPNHVDFNESLANFVGIQGAVDFYRQRCQVPTPECIKDLEAAQTDMRIELELAQAITRLYDSLDTLYKSKASSEEKISKRSALFDSEIAPLRAKYPKMKILNSINNAEIMQLKIYMTNLADFHKLFLARGSSWELLLKDLKDIREALSSDKAKSPFELLRSKIDGTSSAL